MQKGITHDFCKGQLFTPGPILGRSWHRPGHGACENPAGAQFPARHPIGNPSLKQNHLSDAHETTVADSMLLCVQVIRVSGVFFRFSKFKMHTCNPRGTLQGLWVVLGSTETCSQGACPLQ